MVGLFVQIVESPRFMTALGVKHIRFVIRLFIVFDSHY